MRSRPYRSKSLALLGICGFLLAEELASCSARDVVVDVPVAAYVPASCGDAGGALVTFTGLGDFAQTSPAAESVPLGSNGFVLSDLPVATRELTITPGVPDAGGWAGAALVPDAGPVEILTLPLNRACSLSKSVGLAGDPGASFGMVDGSHALLVSGMLPPFLVDLGNGSVTQLDVLLPRDYATITPFGAGALIAGGEDPTLAEAETNAALYVPGQQGTLTTVDLPSAERKQHGAVALADGRVLLVGGITDKMASPYVLSIDVFDPAHPTQPSTLSTATLQVGRVLPTVIALPNGEVFIGGGFDAMGNPRASVEWLGADLSSLGGPQSLCGAASEQGFAATEGGAVLAVMGMPATSTCSNVSLLRPAGVESAPAIDPPPSRVRLFTGAAASPVLVTDGAAFRWNPWTAVFTSLGGNAAGLNTPTATYISASSGLALWLGEDSNVWTLRFDTHGEYATDTAHGPYLVTDDLYTAPDQLTGPDAPVNFAVEAGATLSNGATVWLTDATFAALTASVTLPVGGVASLVLRDPAGNEVTCSAMGVAAEGVVSVVRAGASVTMNIGDGGTGTACQGSLDASVRVAVGLRGPPADAGTSTVRRLAVQR